MIKKELRDQRKGEDDNVIPFEQPALATAPTPPGEDWLRQLPPEARFVAKPMNYKGPWLHHYGIGCVMPWGILLAYEEEPYPGMRWRWVDSKVFSQQNQFVGLIPMMEEEPDQPAKE